MKAHTQRAHLFFCALTSLYEEHFRFTAQTWTNWCLKKDCQIFDKHRSSICTVDSTNGTVRKNAANKATVTLVITCWFISHTMYKLIACQIILYFNNKMQVSKNALQRLCKIKKNLEFISSRYIQMDLHNKITITTNHQFSSLGMSRYEMAWDKSWSSSLGVENFWCHC